jgi:hypothetical protein
MNHDLHARIAAALAAAGLGTARNTTTRMRPQWRASFSYRGQIEGEKAYLHVYVPVESDRLQVNCSVPAPAADRVPPESIEAALGGFNASNAPGTQAWADLLGRLGAVEGETEGWSAQAGHHMGMQHRMVLARVTVPLESLSNGSLGLAVRLGLRLATSAREALNSGAG